MPNTTWGKEIRWQFKPFVTYNAEGDTFTLHFYLGKDIRNGANTSPHVPCLRCGMSMAGFVGPLGICTAGPGGQRGKCCNATMFPYLDINHGNEYHDHVVTPDQLAVTYGIANDVINEPAPDGYECNEEGLASLKRHIKTAMLDRETARIATRVDEPLCAQCGFKEPCSCAAFSQEVTECQDTTQ